MKHRLALLDLKVFWATVFILVVEMLLVMTISASASAEDGLLGLPWIWFDSSGNGENGSDRLAP